MTEKDLECVISVLKEKKVAKKADWYSVLGFLFFHRLAGLFYSRAKKQDLAFPKKIEKILQETFLKQQRKVVFMRKQLKEITERLSQAGARYMLLKGSVLCNIAEEDVNIYQDGERVSNDIDLLVKSDEIASVGKLLYELGFVQGRYISEDDTIQEFSRLEIVKRRLNRGEVAPFVKKTGDKEFPFIEVDVNFSLGNTPSEGQKLLEEMIDSARTYKGKVKMSVPMEELFFLHLIMHQYKESRLFFMVDRAKDLDLYKLADIYYLFHSGVLDFQRLYKLVEKHGLQQQTGSVLKQVGEAFFDEKIIGYAKKFECEPPTVIDYERKKEYGWQADVRKRLCAADSKKYLKEIKE